MMDLIQFISFILVMLAMSLLSRKRAKEKQQAQFPETKDEDGHKQKDNLKKFLNSLDIDMEEDEEHEAPPPAKIQSANSFQAPPPAPMQPPSSPAHPSHRLVRESAYRFQDRLDDYYPTSPIETKKWQTSIDNLDNKFTSREVVSSDLQSAKVSADLQSANEAAYKMVAKNHDSRGRKLVQGIASRKEMIIYQEIISPPLSVRPPRY
jgi:type IV secretory pathway VirB10-like protein